MLPKIYHSISIRIKSSEKMLIHFFIDIRFLSPNLIIITAFWTFPSCHAKLFMRSAYGRCYVHEYRFLDIFIFSTFKFAFSRRHAKFLAFIARLLKGMQTSTFYVDIAVFGAFTGLKAECLALRAPFYCCLWRMKALTVKTIARPGTSSSLDTKYFIGRASNKHHVIFITMYVLVGIFVQQAIHIVTMPSKICSFHGLAGFCTKTSTDAKHFIWSTPDNKSPF